MYLRVPIDFQNTMTVYLHIITQSPFLIAVGCDFFEATPYFLNFI